MEFYINEENQNLSELLVLPFWEGKQGAEEAVNISSYQAHLRNPTIMQDFKGKEGEVLFVYGESHKQDKRLALLGLGNKEKINVEKLRRSYAQLTKTCHQKKLSHICLLLPQVGLSSPCYHYRCFGRFIIKRN